jgi:hypothetical protein
VLFHDFGSLKESESSVKVEMDRSAFVAEISRTNRYLRNGLLEAVGPRLLKNEYLDFSDDSGKIAVTSAVTSLD